VGKAKNLKNRLLSYKQLNELSPRIREMVSQAKWLSWQILDSELEALLVEAELINTYQPPFNILLKDDKSPLYIMITKEEWPRVLRVRKRDAQKKNLAGEVFGPFTSSYKVSEVLKIARHIFPWCNARREKKMRRCFYNHLGLCPGVCTDEISRADYLAILKDLTLFLRGKKNAVKKSLQTSLKERAKNEQYEQAAKIRDQLQAIEEVTSQSMTLRQDLFLPSLVAEKNQDALIKLSKILHDYLGVPANFPLQRLEGYDVSNTSGKLAVVSMVVMTAGQMDKSEYKYFNIKTLETPNDFAMLKEALLRRSKHDEWRAPDLLVIDGGRGQVGKVWRALRGSNFEKTLMIGLEKRPDRLVLPILDAEKMAIADWKILTLGEEDNVLQLLQQVRDEAHRFGKSRHVARREKKLLNLG
jgi:excinuclease ABC subunit C